MSGEGSQERNPPCFRSLSDLVSIQSRRTKKLIFHDLPEDIIKYLFGYFDFQFCIYQLECVSRVFRDCSKHVYLMLLRDLRGGGSDQQQTFRLAKLWTFKTRHCWTSPDSLVPIPVSGETTFGLKFYLYLALVKAPMAKLLVCGGLFSFGPAMPVRALLNTCFSAPFSSSSLSSHGGGGGANASASSSSSSSSVYNTPRLPLLGHGCCNVLMNARGELEGR